MNQHDFIPLVIGIFVGAAAAWLCLRDRKKDPTKRASIILRRIDRALLGGLTPEAMRIALCVFRALEIDATALLANVEAERQYEDRLATECAARAAEIRAYLQNANRLEDPGPHAMNEDHAKHEDSLANAANLRSIKLKELACILNGALHPERKPFFHQEDAVAAPPGA